MGRIQFPGLSPLIIFCALTIVGLCFEQGSVLRKKVKLYSILNIFSTKYSAFLTLLIITILFSGGPRCSWFKDDVDTTDLLPSPLPYVSAHSPSWAPNSSRIIFCFAPLKKTDDTTYNPIVDSAGWWFIKPDGESLSYFIDVRCDKWEWHPCGDTLISCVGWGYPSLLKLCLIDTTITTFGYFKEGAFTPRYSANGVSILLIANDGTHNGVWIMNADGSNPRFLISSYTVGGYIDWSPDGHTIAYQDWDGGLSVIDTNGTNIRKLVGGKGLMGHPAFSPDGKKIVFALRKDEFKDYEIYVINTDGTALKKLTTGRYPDWSPDGSKIVFLKYSYWGNYEEGNGQLWIMDSNGADQRQLTFVRE